MCPPSHPLNLLGKHYLITGAASGIGSAVAVLLNRLGASLSLVDRDANGLQETVRLAAAGQSCYQFDLKDIDGIDRLVADVVSKGGRLHGVVHSAGLQSIMPAKALTVEGWREIFAVNTESALALAKAMQSKKVYAGDSGSIVFISSIMALAGSPGAIAYSMSKSALHGMARSLALEYASKRIRVNCVAPGFVRTPLFERTEKFWDAEQKRAVELQHPLGFGEPEDIANAVAFLLADTGRWITGTVLVVDGGYLAR
jgi:NAD(P)-dependent dehydrogenase (short-subunit alcohol dehydrogenase family)